ncbi:MAG: Zn-ribbon domain-containing OB-fold protein [Pseudomonadota bacterium]
MSATETPALERSIPAPKRHPDTRHFWEAADQRRLLYKHCGACGKPHFYPRPLCPFCFSDATEWREASGGATLYTYTVMRRADPPYAIAFVTLDEGVSMMTNIVDADFDALRIGQRVRLKWQAAEDGTPVAMFAPA